MGTEAPTTLVIPVPSRPQEGPQPDVRPIGTSHADVHLAGPDCRPIRRSPSWNSLRLAELGPRRRTRVLHFHVVKEIHELILDAVRRPRTAIRPGGVVPVGRSSGAARARTANAAAARRGPSLKKKASFVFRHRHLVVTRRRGLAESERDDLTRMLGYLPVLGVPRRLADPDVTGCSIAQGPPPGELPPGRDRARPDVPGRARTGQDAGTTR